MLHRTTDITISPTVLKWARASSGYSHEDVARYLKIQPELILSWEKENEPVTLRISQLSDLSHYYKRPMAALLLSEPPQEPALPKDFRRAFQPLTTYSPELRLAVRRSRRLRRIARELLESTDLSTKSKIKTVDLKQEPEVIARELRRTLDISDKEQWSWGDQWQAYRYWRELIESLNIFVFQSDFPREEAQGFSLSDSYPFVIMISSKDSPTARCFTLFHEFAHLLLEEGGVCITDTVYHRISNEFARTEDWCHRFAEAFLISRDALSHSSEVFEIAEQVPDYEQALRRLASRFKVSQAVVLFRLWHCDFMSRTRFRLEYMKLRESMKIAKLKATKRGEGWQPPAQRAVQERGRHLSRLVLDALDREVLGFTEAADYLGIRTKHLDNVRKRV